MSLIREGYDSPWHAAGVLLAVLVGFALIQQPEPVSLHVEGGYYRFEPATIRLRVVVERNPDNRGLMVGLHSAGYSTSSYEALEGEKAPRTRWKLFADVPAGVYHAYSIVERVDGTRAEDLESLTIYERGGF